MSWMASPLDVAAGAGNQQRDGRIALLAQRGRRRQVATRHLVVDLAEHHHEAGLEEQLLFPLRGRPSGGLVVGGGEVVGVRHGVGAVKTQSAALLGVR